MGAMTQWLLEQAERCRVCEQRPRQVDREICGETFCCRQCAAE
jgi:hypothetical protein